MKLSTVSFLLQFHLFLSLTHLKEKKITFFHLFCSHFLICMKKMIGNRFEYYTFGKSIILTANKNHGKFHECKVKNGNLIIEVQTKT